jgi:ferric enterobactin receptor
MKTLTITFGLMSLTASPAVFAKSPNKSQQQQTTLQAAQENTFTVTGRVLDKEGGNGMDLANVVLELKTNPQQQYFNYTEPDGSFAIADVPEGVYRLTVYLVGFKNYEQEVSISENNKSLGTITLIADATQLKEVVVTDFKKVIEQRPDGINYNVENDKSASGSSATDVLRKVPMVTVDMEGNVKLRGNSNIKVLIDGKPSDLLASSVKDALRQIPADNIKSIEVLTSPGAKYDGEGASGVINIITKKKVVGGFSGTVFAGPSYNFDQNLANGHIGANLNYRKGKLGLNTSFGYSRWSMVLDSDGTRTDFPGQANETQLLTKQHMLGYGNFGWSKLGVDYQIDSLQSIQASVNYNPGEWNQEMDLSFKNANADYTRSTDQRNPRSTFGVNAAYTKKFKKAGRNLDLLAAYSINKIDASYSTLQRLNTNQNINYQEINDNPRDNNEFTFQGDFVEPLKKKGQKLEFGIKAINRDIASDYTLSARNNTSDNYEVQPNRSGYLDYNQTVGAAYGQFTTPLSSKLSMVAGARYEGTYINGHNQRNGGAFELPMFHNFLPNVVFMYNLKNFNKLKLSYNKRINRPSIDFVNPYIDYSDPNNLKQGNPNLDPERTHNVELGYSTFFGRTSVNASLFHRYTDNAIEQSTVVNPATLTSMTTFGNIAKLNTTGLDVFTNTTLFGKWMINLTGNLYHKYLNSAALNRTNDGWEYSGNIYTNYTINSKYSLNGFAMYTSNQVMLQGIQDGWYYYFFGGQMNILKGKGQIGLAVENIFTSKMNIGTRLDYVNATQRTNTVYSGRGVKLSFNWSFGKMQFAQEKAVKNDDLKKDNSGQMGAGGGR